MLICLMLSIGLLKCSHFLLDFLLATLIGDFHYYAFLCIIWPDVYIFVFLISVPVFFNSGSFFLFSSSLLEFHCVSLSPFLLSSSVSIIITNSSDSLPSTLYTSVFWLFFQRLSHSLSMETSPTVFPFFSVQFNCSAMSNALQPHECSMPGLPVHHQLQEFTQTCVH